MELNDAITTFDTLYTTNEIQILKLALPLLSASIRPYAATIIKIKELKYCLDQLPHSRIQKFSLELDGLDSFVDNALPYCNKSQRELFSQIRNIKSSMKMFEKMQCMMSLMGDESSMDPGEMFKAFQSFSFFTGEADMNKNEDSEDATKNAANTNTVNTDSVNSDSGYTDSGYTDSIIPASTKTDNKNIIHFNDYQNPGIYEHNRSTQDNSNKDDVINGNADHEYRMNDTNERGNINDTNKDYINVSSGSSPMKATGSSFETMLQSALSAEQKEMFKLFKSRFDSES